MHDPRTDPYLHQVELNASLQLAVDQAAKQASAHTAERMATELRKIAEDFFNPALRAVWMTVPPSGGANPSTQNLTALIEGRWNLYKITLLSADGTHYPSQVVVQGINGAESIYLNSIDKLLELNYPVWDIQALTVTNQDPTYYARLIVEFKKSFRTPYGDDEL